MTTRRFIDLSHRIADGEGNYPGLPAPEVAAVFTHAESRGRYTAGTEFHVGRVTLCAHTGTTVDAPFHRFRDGADVAALPLHRLADLPSVLIDTDPSSGRAIPPSSLPGHASLEGCAVLFRTGWSSHWGDSTYGAGGHPYLTGATARALVDARCALVGIDSLNVDDTSDATRPAHSLLLGAGIPVVEHLTNLDAIPVGAFRFTAVPAPIAGMGSFPVRAFAAFDPTP